MSEEMKFKTGSFYVTSSLIEAVQPAADDTAEVNDLKHEIGEWVADCMKRHVTGDWGDASDNDKAANDAALVDGGRILSSYRAPEKAAAFFEGKGCDTSIWIVTEAASIDGEEDGRVTTILFPSDY
jgi:formylglycine-generating enzyme required for sulfatase activity